MNNRDEDSFKVIFEEFYSPLCNYALKILGNRDEAEDIVQNVFIQLWTKNRLAEVRTPESYLIRSVKFKCIDFIRARKQNVEIDIERLGAKDPTHLSDMHEEEIEPLLNYFAAKLPPKTRQVFLLSRQAGLTYKEIAAEMDISIKTVENQMGRALKQMRAMLKARNLLSLFLFL